MSGNRSFPLNAWYVAAWDTEVKPALLARTICSKKVVFYRATDGRAVALEDACWHRLVPLSQGKLHGDDVACPYHGLRFNPNGRCTYMPSQDTINPSARVRSFPVVEKYRFVWIWPGDPALADPDLVPDLHWNDDTEHWVGEGSMVPFKGNYLMCTDNLLDLSHETYVHPKNLGNQAVAESPFEVIHGEKTATVSRWMLNVSPPPFWRSLLGREVKVDRWQITHFLAPCYIILEAGVAVAGTGAPQGDRSQALVTMGMHLITPETETSSHYFWNITRNFKKSEQRMTTTIRDGVFGILAEDAAIIAAQQEAALANPDKVYYNLNVDGGGMWARRKVDEMLAKEQGSASVQIAAE